MKQDEMKLPQKIQCNHCDYKSRRTWCINRHSLKKHGIAYQPSNQTQIKQYGNGIQSHVYQAPTSVQRL